MRVLETVALSIWVGAMTAFAFIFAPIAFHVLSDLDTFARLVGLTITTITYVGFVCAVLIALALFLQPHSKFRRARCLCLAVMIASSLYELWVIMPAMQHLLTAAGGSLTALAQHDPQRLAYDHEHGRSSAVYSITLLAGFAALILRALDPPRAVYPAS